MGSRPARDRSRPSAARHPTAPSRRGRGAASSAGNSSKTSSIEYVVVAAATGRSRPTRRFSSTVSDANTRRPSGTWISPLRALPCTPSLRHSAPSNVIDPLYGTRPEIAFSVDVLPAPLGPISARTSPSPTVRSIPEHGLDRAVRHFDVRAARASERSSSTPRYASTTRWSANTVAAGPTATRWPSSSTATRSHSDVMKSSLWSMSRIATPSSLSPWR